jgi:plastocyanin domain-containing protein
MFPRSIVLASVLLALGCDTKGAAPATAGGGQRLEIAVTENGFEPDKLSVHKDEPVTLVFTRKTDVTCAKQVIFDPGDGKKINKELPLNKPIEIAVTFPKSGDVRYACDMNMIAGVITVQ